MTTNNPSQFATPAPPSSTHAPPIPTHIPHAYVTPIKRITNPSELSAFHRSPTFRSLIGYIQRLCEVAEGKPNIPGDGTTSHVHKVNSMLDELSKYIDEIPPLAQPMRYGNKAYRTWHAKMLENISQLHAMVLPPELSAATQELGPYLLDSFGNPTRLDYGTGHELHFVVWTYCLRVLGVLTVDDEPDIVLNIFPRYLTLARKLQKTYGLEPAGSHGVWSLDDYQFIPFIWGASQLIGNKTIKPADAIKPEVADKYANEYLYLSCIHFIFTVKKGPFYEHSQDLYQISAAANWNKICQGMVKKFQDDVVAKVPIMQHFLFGSIVPYTP
eukprot:Phypoly_transcript_13314.p1 GENE.Phypoly_transcript_13314~~Phypoly_transcript_13314.p1  ORF type:complete len:344 (+),score=53.04 Phypoly_transcript_13314:51-1034(+)